MPCELQSAVLVRRLRSRHRTPRAASGISATVGGTASFRCLGISGQKPRSGGSKDDLLESVWGGRIVSESTLASRINAARRIIGDNGEQQRLIRTTIGKGVRFVGKVREQQDTNQSTAPPSAPRLSIVVLPFTNFSSDPERDCLADGITDDLTTDLARISGGFIVAPSTAFTFKGKPVDVKKIGRDLGVRYAIEGSVRSAGDLLRLNVQLTDAESGAHLWADRFDTDPVGLAQAQSEITGRLARTLNVKLVEAESRRIERENALDPDPRDLLIRGWAVLGRPVSAATMQEALRVFERVLDRLGFGRRQGRGRLYLVL
jgi:TolB-like protein